MKWILLIALFSINAVADDQGKSLAGFDVKTDIIAHNYEAGPYLIYDCVEKHWTCVMKSYFTNCEEKRTQDLKNPEAVYYSCAPIAKLPTKKSCFQKQLFLTSHNHGERFCVKDAWKEKAIP
jgi:hypothetical protein